MSASITNALTWEQQWVLGNGNIFLGAPAGNVIKAFDLYDSTVGLMMPSFDYITARLDDPGKI